MSDYPGISGCEARWIDDPAPPCGSTGKLYLGTCVHEHLLPLSGRPLAVCAVHAAKTWHCDPCRAVDGHRCPVTLIEVETESLSR